MLGGKNLCKCGAETDQRSTKQDADRCDPKSSRSGLECLLGQGSFNMGRGSSLGCLFDMKLVIRFSWKVSIKKKLGGTLNA
mgnify:CR=1 FL=1